MIPQNNRPQMEVKNSCLNNDQNRISWIGPVSAFDAITVLKNHVGSFNLAFDCISFSLYRQRNQRTFLAVG